MRNERYIGLRTSNTQIENNIKAYEKVQLVLLLIAGICVGPFERVVIVSSDICWSLFQFILAILWYYRYVNPAKNNPNITAINLITLAHIQLEYRQRSQLKLMLRRGVNLVYQSHNVIYEIRQSRGFRWKFQICLC